MFGKRFIFAAVAIICATITTIILKYPAAEYVKLMGLVIGIFTISQTVTDIKENHNGVS